MTGYTLLHLPASTLLITLCVLTACSRSAPDLSRFTEEEPPPESSELQVADPLAARQLLSGWYPVEQNSWRWTAKNFAVILRRPVGAAKAGARLTLEFTLPDVVLSRLRSVTLRASIEGAPVAPETYRAVGKQTYARDVPASLLSRHTLRVDFALDKALPPNPADRRELGLIVDRVGLDTK